MTLSFSKSLECYCRNKEEANLPDIGHVTLHTLASYLVRVLLTLSTIRGDYVAIYNVMCEDCDTDLMLLYIVMSPSTRSG